MAFYSLTCKQLVYSMTLQFRTFISIRHQYSSGRIRICAWTGRAGESTFIQVQRAILEIVQNVIQKSGCLYGVGIVIYYQPIFKYCPILIKKVQYPTSCESPRIERVKLWRLVTLEESTSFNSQKVMGLASIPITWAILKQNLDLPQLSRTVHFCRSFSSNVRQTLVGHCCKLWPIDDANKIVPPLSVFFFSVRSVPHIVPPLSMLFILYVLCTVWSAPEII